MAVKFSEKAKAMASAPSPMAEQWKKITGEDPEDYGTHLNKNGQPAIITTTVVKKHKGQVVKEDNDQKTVAVQSSMAPMATVTVGGKRTLNLGDFNSASIMVTLSMPCDPKDIDKVYEATAEWISQKIEKAVEDA